MPKGIKKHPETGFEHLHRHSDFSLLDGFATVSEYAQRMVEINQKFLCITDHGVMGAVPQQIKEADKYNLYPLFGIEFYVNPLQPESSSRAETAAFYKSLGDSDYKTKNNVQSKFRKSYHLLAIAKNDVGYSNLVRMSSWGWIHGFYYKPRINHEVIKKYHEGIIFTSGCGNSEIACAFFEGGDEAGFRMIEKYLDMVGRDNFYLEIMMLDWKLQKDYNSFLIRAHEKYNLPIIITQDCHYCRKEHSRNQRLMLMQQKKITIQQVQKMIKSGADDDIFVLQDSQLWLKSEEEMNEMWETVYRDNIDYEIYKQAKENVIKICEQSKGVSIDRELKLPMIPHADEILWDEIIKGLKDRGLDGDTSYMNRVRSEYELICEKGFSSYFLIQKSMVDEARRVGPKLIGFGDGSESVGPGRGCVIGYTFVFVKDDENDCVRVKKISQVREGNLVLTRNGHFRKVIKTHKYQLNKDDSNDSLVLINAVHGDLLGIVLTHDHEVLAIDNDKLNLLFMDREVSVDDLDWICASQLSLSHWCFFPDVNVGSLLDVKKQLSLLANCDYDSIEISDDSWFFLGCVLGYFTNCECKKYNNLYFSICHHDECEIMPDNVSSWIKDNSQCEVIVEEYGYKKSIYCVDLMSCDSDNFVFRFLKNYFVSDGKLDISKEKIHRLFLVVIDWLYCSSHKSIASFLKGFFANYEILPGSKSDIYLMNLFHQEFVHKLCQLLFKVGIPCNIFVHWTTINNDTHSVVVNADYIKRFVEGDTIKNVYGYKKIRGGSLVKLDNIQHFHCDEKYVYDLTVDGDENYATTAFLIHNSVCGSLVAYCLRLHDVDPIKHDLKFSRFLSPARGGKQMKTRFTISPVRKSSLYCDKSG